MEHTLKPLDFQGVFSVFMHLSKFAYHGKQQMIFLVDTDLNQRKQVIDKILREKGCLFLLKQSGKGRLFFFADDNETEGASYD